MPVVLAAFLTLSLINECQEHRDDYVHETHRYYGWPWICASRHVRLQYDREQSDDGFKLIDRIDFWSVDPRGLCGNFFVTTLAFVPLIYGPRAVTWAFSADPYNDRGSSP